MQPASQATISDVMPWVTMTLDYTEQVAAAIPEDKLDWRPSDPSGKWSFSLGEIAMHCADSRLMFARTMAGEDDNEEGYWLKYPEGEGESVWTRLREPANKQEILDSLRAGRAALQPWLDKPVSELLSSTDGHRKSYEDMLAKMREKGKDSAEAERRGPANINRSLMATACHEAGHRGALQTLLRQFGINVKDE
jgi:uncharacterized damage-inducible protein DinB